jgi:hypothetical protein
MMVMEHEHKLQVLKLCIDLAIAFRLGIQVFYHVKERKPLELVGFAFCLSKDKFFDTIILNQHLNDNFINYNGILWKIQQKDLHIFQTQICGISS